MRIVAEAVFAARRGDHLARPTAFGDQRLRIRAMAHQHDHAVVVRAPASLVRQSCKQLSRCCAHPAWRPRLALRRHSTPNARPARRRALRRKAPNRRRARAGRETRLAWRALASAFSTKVACGSSASAMPSCRLRNNIDAERREQRLDLAQLAGIGRCEHQSSGTKAHSARAPCCCAMSSRCRLASAISASISARENGAPSAVPCTSTKPPAPVITTFMSVSQPESSA